MTDIRSSILKMIFPDFTLLIVMTTWIEPNHWFNLHTSGLCRLLMYIVWWMGLILKWNICKGVYIPVFPFWLYIFNHVGYREVSSWEMRFTMKVFSYVWISVIEVQYIYIRLNNIKSKWLCEYCLYDGKRKTKYIFTPNCMNFK